MPQTLLVSVLGPFLAVIGGLFAYGLLVSVLTGVLAVRRDQQGRPLSTARLWTFGLMAGPVPVGVLVVGVGIWLSAPSPSEREALKRAQVTAFCANWQLQLVSGSTAASAVALVSEGPAAPWLSPAIKDRWETCAKSSLRRADGVEVCADVDASPGALGQLPTYRMTSAVETSIRLDHNDGSAESLRRMSVRIEDRDGTVLGSTHVYDQSERGSLRNLCPSGAVSVSELLLRVFPRPETK